RRGAKFHDGGEITAEDVVYSFRRVLALGKAPAGAFKPVLKPDSVTAPDKNTVRFVLDHAYAPFLAAVPIVMIVNPRSIRTHEATGVHIEKDTSMRVFVLRMNNKKPPLDNINARKCLAHAFNYDGFIKEILKGYAVRNPAPMPNNLWGYPKDVAGYDYDLKKAKALCDKAKAEGAPIDRPIEIHIQSQL